ncbi:MAG: helicase, partial [Gemmatimonadetes bacterium]|nr:helicase [Gemmatimonadota bacterium]
MEGFPVSHPEFVDNLDGNTLERALREHLDHLLGTLRDPPSVSIATGYFNPGGFGRLFDVLRQAAEVRLLLGAEPVPAARLPERRLGEPRGERYEKKLADEELGHAERKLRRDRDRLPFSVTSRAAVGELLKFLASGKIEVRRYGHRFLHGKAFLFSDNHGVVAGSSNFTLAGLTSNLELNLGQYQPGVVTRVEQWFDRLWNEAEPYDLAAIYREQFIEHPPYLIYLRALWERYGDELEEEAGESGRIRLTRFQTDGVFRAKRILAAYNGVLVADSVGLGKSFIAAELFTEVIEQNRQRALLIAPAQLRDGMWSQFKTRYQVGIEVVSFEQLAGDRQLGQGEGSALSADVDDYSLIVIDEAHAFRNPDSKRARALRQLLRGDPPRKVVLLTATPVNNSLWDLYDLLTYFVGHDAVFADRGIPSLKRRFQQASDEDPFSLSPDTLFDILDETTVRRTRHFVQRYYPNDNFQLKDGTEVTIRFPDPVVRSRSYDLDHVLPGFFDEFAEILDSGQGDPKLTMARYWPTRYRREGAPDSRETALVGLIRSGLLKRFESSSRAFVRTVTKMVAAHDDFARAVEAGVIPSSDSLAALQETDSDEAWEALLREGEPVEDDLDTRRLLEDVRSDRSLLDKLRDRAATVRAENDPKLRLLLDELARIAATAQREGISEGDVRNRRKVLVFSYFGDTVEWIAEHLGSVLETDRRLAGYRGRLAVVRGPDSFEGVTRTDAVFGFAPLSTEAPPGRADDKYDILVTTDVLAEGMNLQQCGRIINYDLPWNPMRLVQRHGRIDRIGSPHANVFLTCVFPDRQLEALLALEERIRRKLAQAAASIGLDQIVIPGTEKTEHVFADDRKKIEGLRKGDPSLFERGGEEVHAHSGEEYRQELRKGIERWGDRIRNLAWGVGSGFVSGARTGYVFCARVFDRVFMRFVPEDPEADVERDTLT